MADSNLLTLRVGGQIYGGWKAVSVRTSIEQLAGNFELALTERYFAALAAGEFASFSVAA